MLRNIEYWTADGYLWDDAGLWYPCEEALTWYQDNPIDEAELGGEA